MSTLRVTCKGAQTLPLDRIEEFQGNLKKLSKKNLEKLKKRIVEDGFNVPFFVWDHEGMYKALDGHQRIKALCSLREEGWDIPLLPVAFIEASDEADARKKLLAISSQYGEFDASELSEWLDEIGGEVAETLRLVDTDIPIEVASEEKEVKDAEPQVDKAEELNKKWQVKQGDVWQLGEHRLMCGDSTSIDAVEKLMDGQKADMVFTDPPYGIDIVGDNGKVGAGNIAKNKVYSKVIADDTTEVAEKAYNIFKNVADGMMIWGGNYFVDFLEFSPSWLIWDKRLDMNSNNFADGEMVWCSFHTRVRIYKHLWNGMIQEGERETRVHPTQKPVKLLGNILKDQTQDGDLILDVFGGSGSTLIACEQLNRTCYMMELDPKYCAVILQRYFDVTGNNPKKVV